MSKFYLTICNNHNQIMRYRNKKNKHIYKILNYAINCTNAQDGQQMCIYYNEENESQLFVREVSEFNEKFEPVK